MCMHKCKRSYIVNRHRDWRKSHLKGKQRETISSREIKFRARKMKESVFFVRGSGLSDCAAAVSRSHVINYLRKRENFRNSRKISVGHRTQRSCRVGGSEATTCYVSARMIYFSSSLSVSATLTFVKSEFFIKNVASAHPDQHRPESRCNYARC